MFGKILEEAQSGTVAVGAYAYFSFGLRESMKNPIPIPVKRSMRKAEKFLRNLSSSKVF